MPAAERGKENKFFAQVFQSLRIEVNQELEALKEFPDPGKRCSEKRWTVLLLFHTIPLKISL